MGISSYREATVHTTIHVIAWIGLVGLIELVNGPDVPLDIALLSAPIIAPENITHRQYKSVAAHSTKGIRATLLTARTHTA